MDLEGGKEKRMLYVGGLDEAVTPDILQAAFVPFGVVTDVQLPMDHVAQKNKGFGFIEFAEESDAKDALDNMHGAAIFGRVIRVTLAKQHKLRHKAVWTEAEEWYSGLKEAGDGAEPTA